MEKELQSTKKKYYYPMRYDSNYPNQVKLVEISEEQYYKIYPEIWAKRKREQFHERCMCRKKYFWKCDGICDECEYHAPGDVLSIDNTIEDTDKSMLDIIPDIRVSIENIVYSKIQLKKVMHKFRELDPDADEIVKLFSEGYSVRKIARIIGRNERTFADQIRKIRRELKKV